MTRWSQENIARIAENLRECMRVSTACRFCAGDPTLCEQSIFTLMALAAEALEQVNTGA